MPASLSSSVIRIPWLASPQTNHSSRLPRFYLLPPLLFLAPTALPSERKSQSVNKCPRRRTSVLAASVTPPADEDTPSWADLARSLGSTDETPARPAPEWKLPEEDVSLTSAESSSAWSSWNAAKARKPAPPKQRDPQKETDFWRTTARDLVSSDSSSAQQLPNSETASQSEIWRLARGVTGEMTELQNRLRADLDRYNPDENTDQYRDIARELVGPKSDEPWTDANAVRPGASSNERVGTEDAHSGSGWNPDVDWKRFDDLRRDEVLRQDKSARAEVARTADENRREALDRVSEAGGEGSSDNVSYVDEDGNELSPDEVQRAVQEGAVFLDEAGTEIDTGGTRDESLPNSSASFGKLAKDEQAFSTLPDGSVPGFIANRFKSRGTYGAGWSGAEDEIRLMQEKGIPLRDPKADTESWLSAARELNIDVEPGSSYNNLDGETASAQENDEVNGEGQGARTTGEDHSQWSSNADSELENLNDNPTLDEKSLWSGWQLSNEQWARAAQEAKPRNPKEEVDVWRSTARDLTETTSEGQETLEAQKGKTDSETSESAWDSWRTADANWKAGIANDGSQDLQSTTSSQWTSKGENSDWGAGLGGKASSERSAWANWNHATEGTFGGDSSLWWTAKADSVSKPASGIQKQPGSDSVDWIAAAKELTDPISSVPVPRGKQGSLDSTSAPLGERGNDSTLDFWKDVAKGLSASKTENQTEHEVGSQ